MKKTLSIAVLAAALLLSPSARAQTTNPLCETKENADKNMKLLAEDTVGLFQDFITEIAIYIDNDLGKTATSEMLDRLDQYNKNIYHVIDTWWDDFPVLPDPVDYGTQKDYDEAVKTAMNGMSDDDKKHYKEKNINDCGATGGAAASPYCVDSDTPPTATLPMLKAVARQISIAKIDQTRQIGSMLDARLVNEKIMLRRQAEAEARARYTPAETTCHMDSLGPALSKTYYFARALARAIAREDTLRRLNYKQDPVEIAAGGGGLFIRDAYALPVPRGPGGGAEMSERFALFATKYCNPAVGAQGCDVPATGPPFPDADIDIPAMLWGDRQTIDFGNQDQRDNINYMLTTFADPARPQPIPGNAINTAQGREALIKRRAHDARINAIYNVMAQMLAERASGGDAAGVGMSVKAMKTATGMPDDLTDANDSYAAVRGALTKSRYLNPAYIARLVNKPAAVAQEQGNVKAIQSQLLNDLIKRNEEMVFMAASSFADDLDHAMPANAHEVTR